jgi:hypothetical protein
VVTVEFFPETITLPFHSSHDLATQAAADLTHALLHPQPAGPFCQVGNDQTIALKRLASMFETAKQRKTKNTLAPQDGIENRTSRFRKECTAFHKQILTNELSQRNLAKDGSRPTTHTHGLLTHDTRPISFSLVVDDFGVKYIGREHAEHLMACIRKKYNISGD